MTKQTQIQQAINKFIDTEISPLMNSMTPMKQFIFGMELGIIKNKSNKLISNFINSSEAKLLELADGENIDIETLYTAAIQAMEKQGTIEVAGIKFSTQDINKLYQIIKEQVSYETGY